MANVRVSWVQLQTATPHPVVRLSWAKFATQSLPARVRISQAQLKTLGDPSVIEVWARVSGAWKPIVSMRQHAGGAW